MKFGVCCGPDLAPLVKQAGYDFYEWSVGGLLKPGEDDAAFHGARSAVQASGIPCPVLNCFLPGTLKITGPDVRPAAVLDYARRACARAKEAGVEVIVLGSGGARHVPAGFDREAARRQLVSFCQALGPVAGEYGVRIAIEPLNEDDCNILNTVAECAELVHAVGNGTIRLLVDSYHLLKQGDSIASIGEHARLLEHVHVGTVPKRLPPAAEPCDLAPFFAALVKGGYQGRVSIEAGLAGGEASLVAALAEMKRLAAA